MLLNRNSSLTAVQNLFSVAPSQLLPAQRSVRQQVEDHGHQIEEDPRQPPMVNAPDITEEQLASVLEGFDPLAESEDNGVSLFLELKRRLMAVLEME